MNKNKGLKQVIFCKRILQYYLLYEINRILRIKISAFYSFTVS